MYRTSLLLLSALLGTACASVSGSGTSANRASGNGTVIGDDLISISDGTVLAVLEKRLVGMDLRRGSDCPRITFRGRKSVLLDSSPLVYVAGQRAANTCVLESLNGDDVSSIEVYPNGVTNRPGYQSAPGGLILVFLKNGQAG